MARFVKSIFPKEKCSITPVGEHNVWADPETVKIVFESGLLITIVGWDVSWMYATFDDEDAERLRSIGTPDTHAGNADA